MKMMSMRERDMPNIFDGLKRISDDEMIEQLALLETMNITNISKPVIQKAKKKTISIINFLGNKLGKGSVLQEPEVKEIWTLIEEKKEELRGCNREELDERLNKVLLEKTKNDTDNPTEDLISMEVIDGAFKLYKTNQYLTPSQKADYIYIKYHEKLSGKAKEYINEMPFVDLQETTQDIEEIINNMDDKQKKEFVQSIEVEKFTLLNVWKKIDRQHFARLVWMAVKAHGGRFTPKEELLPSFVENEKEVEIEQKNAELKKSKRELFELKNKMESCKNKLTTIESNLKKENIVLNNAIRSRKQAEEDLIDLGKIDNKLETVKKNNEEQLNQIKDQMEKAAVLEEYDVLMEEYKKAKFDSIDINNKLSDIVLEGTFKRELIEDNIKTIGTKEESIKKIADEFQQLKNDTSVLIEEYNEKQKEVHTMEEIKRNEIFERWSKFFIKFIFEFKALNNVVDFSTKELLHIEECLYEIHGSKDPEALSIGLIEGRNSKNEKEDYHYIDVSYPDKFQIEIHYRVLKNEEKNVQIVGITTEF